MSNRYDRSIDADHFNSASSQEKILMQIQPGSKVLECGCATGYMTRYMRDELGCEVFIVEYDAEAYDIARQYASDGICADLMQPEWLAKFQGEQFDYILFADVLEHLYDPQAVLKSAVSLLKEGGSVLASVPNIAHGDVLMNLLRGNWNYTDAGLLDKTHIRFFAENNLEPFFHEAGLSVIRLDYTVLPVGQTEQAFNNSEIVNVDLGLLNILNEGKNTAVYQFIITAQSTEYVEQYHVEKEQTVKLHKTMATLYYSQGDGFSEENTQKTFYTAPDFHQRFDWKNVRPKLLRFDPVEDQACVITSIQVLSNEGELEICPVNGYRLEHVDFFATGDPQYLITVEDKSIKWIEIHAQIVLVSNGQIGSGIAQLTRNCVRLEEAHRVKDVEAQELRQEVYSYQQEIQGLQQKAYGLEQETQELHQEVHGLQQQYEALRQQLVQTQYDYSVISNAFFWKITKPARVITDALKSLLKKNRYTWLFCKGLKCLKQNGFSYTWSKLKRYYKYNTRYKVRRSNLSERYEIESVSVNGPSFSILTPLYNTPENLLREMIESVLSQTYVKWELCLADGSSEDYVEVICAEYARNDSRIHYSRLEKNLGISENSNACAAMADGEFLVLLDHDDVLSPYALYENARAILKTQADVLYSDEDHIAQTGLRVNPFFKPDWSPDLLYCQMYVCHLLVFRRSLFSEVGGFRSQFDGSQDYDLMLRLSEKTERICHIPEILYSWRDCEGSTASGAGAKPYAYLAGQHALDEHLKKKYGLKAYAESHSDMYTYNARFPLLIQPLVSIIIPMRDKYKMTETCIKSILEKSSYQNFEILLLDNRSEEKETKQWLEYISAMEKRVRVIEADMEFNWSKLNNLGVSQANGDIFVFLNNDTIVISEDWIERLSENALRDDIGVVGALLLYPDETIQHAGVVVGMGDWADHIFKGMRPIHFGAPYVSPVVSRNVLAVTGACMAVSRKAWEKIGAFDEEFIICGSDVEYGIRAYEKGLFNRYDANVRLYHLESKSRDTYIPDIDFKKSYAVYAPYHENIDPFFNINLDTSSVVPKERI